ncbi:MAG: ribosomal RNA large subunit methyltransferase H [Thermodesulfovibrio sp.]|nr:ribosomal RNA large subunit methyltransferase H [Thermodesulfovibrio sp.]
MKINLIWVGKTKEQFIRDGIEKYLKLVSHYADIAIVEVKEEKGSNRVMTTEREGERIMKLGMPYVLLDEKGMNLTSVQFAEYIGQHAPRVNFVMGGAFGVSDKVRAGAQEKLSLSRMTFTHEMARIFLLEQLYRAFSIINRKGYHH